MTWSYDSALTENKDRLRFYVGDTDDARPLLENEEIDFLLTQHSSVSAALLPAVEVIVAKLGRNVSRTIGKLKVEAQQAYEHYKQMAREIKSGAFGAAGGVPIAYAGGISVADKESVERDTDRVQPAFRREMFDHWGTATDDERDD